MPTSPFSVFRRLTPYIKQYRWQYLGGFLSLVFVDAAQMLVPQFVKSAIDLVSAGAFDQRLVTLLCVQILGLAVIISVGRFLWRYFIHGSSRRIETSLRDLLFAHLETLSPSFYQRIKTGDLMARATGDLNAIRQAVGMGVVAFVDGTFMAVSIIVILLVQSPRLALAVILPLPVITVLMLRFGSLVGSRFQRSQEAYSHMSDIVQESFAGIRVIVSFVKEKWFAGRFASATVDYRGADMSVVRVFGFFFPFITFLSGLSTLLLLFFGSRYVIDGRLSPGELVAMSSYLGMLVWPIMGAGFTINTLQRGAASMRRINEILDEKPEILSAPDAQRADFGDASTAVECRNLSFAYGDGTPTLSGITFSLERGKVLGILGRTGSGKSTLLKLLPRMLEPPEGTLFVADLDVRRWDLRALRESIACTPQDSFLFSDTIRANIAYSSSSMDDARARKAAEASTIERDMADFPLGWDTVIGERGLTLSGGQKQRVAISRAVAKDAPILILDDALSAVDTATEELILDALLAPASGRTVVFVSNRISTLRRADLVLVLEEGRMAQFGPPETLAALPGFYAETARLQALEHAARDLDQARGTHHG